jgi:hypothetical protein
VYEEAGVAENISGDTGTEIISVYDAVAAADVKSAALADLGISEIELVSVLDLEGLDLGDNVKGLFAQTIYYTGDNTWKWADDNPSNPRIVIPYVVFYAAGTDTLVLRNGSITGPIFLAYTAAAAGAYLIPTYDIKASPVFVPADGSYTLGSYFSIIYKER